MNEEEKERLIKKDIVSIENRVRHAFNQGYEMGLKERQNTCEDAISRQSAIFLASDLKQDLPDDERISDMVMSHNEGILEYQSQLSILPSVNPQPCEDVISRKSIKQKLQEHHDFFVNAYGGFSNLPQNDKSRVDEISNCIAMVVNEPPVTPQPRTGHWIYDRTRDWDGECKYECSECGMGSDVDYPYCMRCGAKMVEPQESEVEK